MTYPATPTRSIDAPSFGAAAVTLAIGLALTVFARADARAAEAVHVMNGAQLPARPTVPVVAVEPPTQGKPDPIHRFDPPRGRTCFGQAETREKIATHRLAEPLRALRAGRLQGDALRAKLCRWKPDEFVYEVSVLRRDGRIAHVYMNAQSGQPVDAPNQPDRN